MGPKSCARFAIPQPWTRSSATSWLLRATAVFNYVDNGAPLALSGLEQRIRLHGTGSRVLFEDFELEPQ